jgi:predicted 3-demethylubiquinone-9 3-methyltransferase (glyoxalase superfamily)
MILGKKKNQICFTNVEALSHNFFLSIFYEPKVINSKKLSNRTLNIQKFGFQKWEFMLEIVKVSCLDLGKNFSFVWVRIALLFTLTLSQTCVQPNSLYQVY